MTNTGKAHLNPFQLKCSRCGLHTSKAYAKAHDGKCRFCAEGIVPGWTRKDWVALTDERRSELAAAYLAKQLQ